VQKCIACGANTDKVTLSFPAFRHVDFSTIGSELSGSVCGHCQLFQNIDSFAKERLSYQTQFYGSSAQTIHKSARNKKKARTRSEIQADCITKILPSSAKACLDIGCFDGALLRALGIVMPAVDKLGYDVNPTHNVVDLVGRLEITSAQEEIFRGRFDAVIYSHSIMYIDNIVNQLKRIRSHLTDEGFVFIQLPDIRINPLYALMGDQAFIFSEDNLGRLLEYSGYDSKRVYLPEFPKELAVIARPTSKVKIEKQVLESVPALRFGWKQSTEMIEELVIEISAALGAKEVLVLGTTIFAAFVHELHPRSVLGFVDENPDRIKGSFRGLPVYHPNSLSPEQHVYVGPDVGDGLKSRMNQNFAAKFF
jgi:trans-aconitate methyltransferase